VRLLGIPPTEPLAGDLADAPDDGKFDVAAIDLDEDDVLPAKAQAADGPRTMPDLTGMTVRGVVRVLNKQKIDADLTGSGVAERQHPPAGTPLKGQARGWVVFTSPHEESK
jgi:hypothetical protein